MKMPRLPWLLPLCVVALVMAGCASRGGKGGYYKDDGPGDDIPANLMSIPDAVPRVERHASANFRPYVVFGQRYVPIGENQPYRQTGVASWYGRKFHGQKTANGETYDMYAMTAAHPTLPLPSYARVTRASTGRSVIVRINDRGPFHSSRIIDLSYVAAAKLGLIGQGSGQVIVEAITNTDIASGRYAGTAVARAPTPAPAPAAAPQPIPVAAPVPVPVQASPALELPPAANGPAPAAIQASAPASVDAIFLQFGAFASEANALALAERVNHESGGLAGQAMVVQDSTLYKVRMGPYDSRTAAVNAAWELSQATSLQPSIALQ